MRDVAKLPILLKELRLKTMQNQWETIARTAIEENWQSTVDI